MMLKLVDIFAYLSVLLRAGTLVFQSLLLGGWLFLFWIARPSSEVADSSLERVRGVSLRLFRVAAIALVVMQVLYLYVNSAVLMATAEIGISARRWSKLLHRRKRDSAGRPDPSGNRALGRQVRRLVDGAAGSARTRRLGDDQPRRRPHGSAGFPWLS